VRCRRWPRARLVAFVEGVVASLPHVRQRENALVYVRGLVEQGGRKSLQPTLFRLGEDAARYESVQQFLADSPWDPGLLVRACAELVAAELGVLAWIVDDTGIAKDGRHSPGVKRQYSGTLGKIGSCQIAVSLHAVGVVGTLPIGWALYLPEDWCADAERRRKAKIPESVVFKTKPQLAGVLIAQAAGWDLPQAPILADCAYGDDSAFRTRLHALEREYVLAVSAQLGVYGPETVFAVPERNGNVGRRRSVARPDRKTASSTRASTASSTSSRSRPERSTASSSSIRRRSRSTERAGRGRRDPCRESCLLAPAGTPMLRARPDSVAKRPAQGGPTQRKSPVSGGFLRWSVPGSNR
jgi:SRSO17 transposase